MDKKFKQGAEDFNKKQPVKKAYICPEAFMRENYSSDIAHFENDNRVPRPDDNDYNYRLK